VGHGLGVDAVTTATALPVAVAEPVLNVTSAPTFFSGRGFRVASFGGNTVCPWGGDNGFLTISATPGCNNCFSALSNCFSVGGTITNLIGGAIFGCVRYGPNTQCWGDNEVSEAGEPNTILSVAPPGNFIALSPPPMDIQAYGAFGCALLNDGVPTLKCWGSLFTNSGTALPPATVPTAFPSGVKASALSTGGSGTACVITTEGSAWCFGDNTYGQIGNGQVGEAVLVPTEVIPSW
jgi:hypothetical protein